MPGGISTETGPLLSKSSNKKSLPQNVPGIGLATSFKAWYSMVDLNSPGSVVILIVRPSAKNASKPRPVSLAGVELTAVPRSSALYSGKPFPSKMYAGS